MQNTVQFILEQQAQLTIKVDKLAESQLSYQSRSGQLEETLGMLVQVIRNMDERADKTEKRLDTTDERLALLREAQSSTDEYLALLAKEQLNYQSRTNRLEESFSILVQLTRDMDERMDSLAEADKQTDEKLGRLITTVERYINEGRNGKSQG
ncbi:MAG TPA: hypothetical protein VGO91_02295 [Pyrinomonadaceae bacterium]|nr:hypothetical protein [Pyrinomonadaceae bacterium]